MPFCQWLEGERHLWSKQSDICKTTSDASAKQILSATGAVRGYLWRLCCV